MTPSDTSDRAVLRVACERAGLDGTTATVLHRHASSIWLLQAHRVVARITRSPDDRGRVHQSLAVTQWLAARGFPTTQPADCEHATDLGGASVTFWRYYPQGGRLAPRAAALGRLLRRLHGLAAPSAGLGDYVPLVRLGAALQADAPLGEDDRAWLTERRLRLLADYGDLNSELGVGPIHGDAYPGNTLWDGDRAILGDWDEVARGPRELDLVNTHQGARIGRSSSECRAFSVAYGWDVTAWPGFGLLREIRDLHTLGAYIERAGEGDNSAAAEVRYRIRTLRAGDTAARWHLC